MSSRLLPCPGCDRHVRIAESACPFCGEGIPIELQQSGPAPLPRRRLGRAAKFAFGAAALGSVALAGCGDDGTPMPEDTGTIAPAYGAVPADTGVDAGADTGPADGGADVPLYGGAPDAG